jgi:hypothetical protein
MDLNLKTSESLDPKQGPGETRLDEDGARAKRARAVAEAEMVLRELFRGALDTLPQPRLSRAANGPTSEQSPTLSQSGVSRRATPLDPLRLDPELDFVLHGHGRIELTDAGCRRMVRAHAAGLDVVIGIDGREVVRFLAPTRGSHAAAAVARPAPQSTPWDAETEVRARRTQPIAELIKAEQSTEVALSMIKKEQERHEIESLLPWHAVGKLNRGDADRVEQALADDSELAQQYELVRGELTATIKFNETLGTPSERAMERLFAAIDAEGSHLPRAPL